LTRPVRGEVFEVARKLLSEKVIKSLVLVDHHLEKVAAFADRVVVLNRGEVILEGPTNHVLSEVELLNELGLQPPETAEVFSRMSLGNKPYPMNVDDAVRLFPPVQSITPPQQTVVMHAEPAVELEDIWFAYEPGQWVINGISLKVSRGEMMALIGQNGSGKTTVAQIIAGILRPAKGVVKVFGKDVTRQAVMVRGKEVGYIFQNPDYQIFSRSVRDEIAYGLRAWGMGEREVEERVMKVSEMVGLKGLLDEDPFFLSKAERQRTAVASILALNPKIIILDEPTTGLSPGETTALMDTVRELNKAGTTIITITHDMWVVAKYCSRVVLMSDGRVVLDGPTREVFSNISELEKYDIEVPQVVRLSNKLFGQTFLTVDEFVENVKTR
jgi:energy-coupling factor transporter ATP-binding protein EcfA2